MNGESRTDRLERLLGVEGVERLAKSRVMVIGIGGVGSNCVEALARGGIGSFVIVDADYVQESNVNRQAIAFYERCGFTTDGAVKEQVIGSPVTELRMGRTLSPR